MATKRADKAPARPTKSAHGVGVSESKERPARDAVPKMENYAISPGERRSLYAAAQYLPTDVEQKFGLQLPFNVFIQDPLVAREHPELGEDEQVWVRWEPGLADGPTSGRFAVVDFNGDTGQLAPAAKWNDELQGFVHGETALNRTNAASLQFHQVNVWVLLQRALAFFESGNGLGRRIPWAFEGNRLIVVPHAGYGQNAYYDRVSKSLQFYYFGSEPDAVFTCLSSDIVSHEFGHAVLDGIRPHFNETASVQTAAFHEFIGDLTAILMSLQNGAFRKWLARETGGDMSKAEQLSSIAEQFGRAAEGKPYLRSARNKEAMSDVARSQSEHRVSQVLTGAMFDIFMAFSKHYAEVRDRTAPQAFWDVAQRMQRMAIQPLDLLPPAEVTFRDYALAVVRAEELANPLDPYGYRQILIKAFRARGILGKKDENELAEPRYLYWRPKLLVFHDIDQLSRSRAAAYRFLDDNRDELLIPTMQDIVVADLYDANKLTREGNRLPRQIVLEYIWREHVPLKGRQYGKFNGQSATMLCGGTLVFDETGTLLSWMRKPGTAGRTLRLGKLRGTKLDKAWADEVEEGQQRRDDLLRSAAAELAAGRLGVVAGSDKGLLGTRLPPVTAERERDVVTFRLSPHLSLSGNEDEDEGERRWELSC
jgi:hypothetical protein